MSRRRTVVLSLAGLLIAVAAGIPLIQKLSIDLMQLQYREYVLQDDAAMGDIARSFEIPPERFAKRLGLAKMAPDEFAALTPAQAAVRSGRTLDAVKRDIADVGIGEQVSGAYGWSFWPGRYDAADAP